MFPGAPLVRWHVRPGELAPDGMDHFGWVRHSAPITERIAEWMASTGRHGHERD